MTAVLPPSDEAQPPVLRPLGAQTGHYWRVQRMARALDVDLVAAWDSAHLPPEDWAEMITACRGCDWTKGCGRWLARDAEGARPVPPGCVNGARFEALRQAAGQSPCAQRAGGEDA